MDVRMETTSCVMLNDVSSPCVCVCWFVSHRPRRAKLSQDLIVLLSIGGVDASVFIDAVNQAAEHVLMVLEDRKRAIKGVISIAKRALGGAVQLL